MDAEKTKIFVRVSVISAALGNLNLTNEQLHCLYRECLEMARDIDDVHTQMVACSALGAVNTRLSRFREAIKYHEIDLYTSQQIGDTAGEGNAYGQLGNCYHSLGQYDKAMHYHEMRLSVAKQIGDKAGEGCANGGLGNCYFSLGHYDKAVHFHEENMNIAKRTGDKAGEGRAHGNLGVCHCVLGQYERAIHHHETHLNITKQIGDKVGEGSAYANLGNCYHSLGQYDKAIHHHEMKLNIEKQVGSIAGQGITYGNLGNCYCSLGQIDKAILHHEMHLNIAKQTGDKSSEGRAYGNLGNCYSSRGQFEKAIHHHKMYLNVVKQTGDKASEGHAYGNLGNCYDSLGQYDMAIQNYEMSLHILKQIGDKAGEGNLYNSLGICYSSLGQHEKAINHHEMALNIAKQIRDKAGEGRAYGNLGNCYSSFGKYGKAILHHKMHLNITKQIGDKAGEGRAYVNLGGCYDSLGEYDKAIRHHEKQLNITKETGDQSGEGSAYCGLGNCYYSLGKCNRAIKHYEMFLNIAKQTGQKADEGHAYVHLGNCYQSLGQYEKAEFNSTEGLRCYDELFENVPKQDQYKVSIREKFIIAYNVLTKALLFQNKTNQALVIAERGRARALAFLMFTRYATQCTEVTETKVLKLNEICEVVKAIGSSVLFFALHIDAIYMWIIQPNGEIEFKKEHVQLNVSAENKKTVPVNPISDIEEKIMSLITRARQIHDVAFTVNCEDRSLSFLYADEEAEQIKVKTGSFTTPEVHPAQTVETFPAAPSPSGAIQSEGGKVTMPSASIDKERRENAMPSRHLEETGQHNIFIEELNESKESVEYNPRRKLYQMVLAPVRKLVEGSQLVVVADGVLNLVPFAALMDDVGHYVAESLQVRLVPSLSTAKMIMEHQQEPRDQASPLIIGDPDVSIVFPRIPRLPCAGKEAEVVGQLFGVQSLTGEKATKESFLQNAENANLIHIAAHGDMKRGEILLAPTPSMEKQKLRKQDFMLMMTDFEKLRVKAKLVVLSCCHSARGKVRAEGVIGIARAFLGAGARSVLVSLWAIDDKATLHFMKTFYEHLTRGEKANESLHKAMKAMRDTAEFADPWHWAPFVLIGDNVSLM